MRWKLTESARKAASTPEPAVNGFFRGRERLVSGWVLDLKDPARKHKVEVFVDGKSIGFARADRYDEAVQSHHGGDGKYAFAIYYDGELSGGLVEATVFDVESGTALRSKLPHVSHGARSGQPLTIQRMTIGTEVRLFGRIGAYPWRDASLEFWSGSERVASDIAVVSLNEAEGLFSAEIAGEALRQLLMPDIQVALPGLKEADLAVTLEKAPLVAVVSEQKDDLRIELRGDFEQTAPIPVRVRFRGTSVGSAEDEITIISRTAIVRPPVGFTLSEGSIEVLLARVSVPIRIEWPLLEEMQFSRLGAKSSAWRVSANGLAETGFFAFPQSLADKHDLSGHIANVSRQRPGGPLLLSQHIRDLPASTQPISITAFVRAADEARLIARLRDSNGVLCEDSAVSRGKDSWSLLELEIPTHREIIGELVFEIEASGPELDNFDVGLGSSRRAPEAVEETTGPNLLVNAGMTDWPDGIGVLRHPTSSAVCAGWRVFNRKSSRPTFSRAVMHPVDSSMGLAIAAPEVGHYLRLEADFAASDITGRPLVLRFRAGIAHSARDMLAREVEAVPQFAIAHRIFIIRRRRAMRQDGFEETDEIVAVFAQKLSIGWDIERFCFQVPAIEEPESEGPDDAEEIEDSYHLAFDFRHPTVIALFDVEVVPGETAEASSQSPALKVEDRNIELQIETLETTAHWRGPTPVRIASPKLPRPTTALKWTTDASREPVEIVIPVFNALPETLDCLDSLKGSTRVPLLVRVIDDGSDKPVREALEEYARGEPWIQVHSFDRNRGYTYAADYGIRQAGTDWVVLLNSDTIVTRGWLEGMLACAKTDPGIGFVGPLSNAASYQSVPLLYNASRKWKVNRLPAGMTPEDMADVVRRVSLKAYPEVPLLNGFCTLMKRSVFVELGGLNSAAFPAGYGEENDLCLRAGKAGVKLTVADDVYVYHVKSASFGNSRRQDLSKNGDVALRRLHPDVDIASLTAAFREMPALVAVREGVAGELSRLYAAAGEIGCAPEEIGGGELAAVDTQRASLQKA